MKKFLATMALGLALIAAPALASDPLSADRSGVYIGGNLGSTLDSDSRLTLGGVAGYQLHPNLRVEGAYDYGFMQSGDGSMLSLNVVPQYRLPNSTVTVYGVGGVGLGWDRWGDLGNGDTRGMYVMGVGARMGVTTNLELDARYRFVNPTDNRNGVADVSVFTVGMNYRF